MSGAALALATLLGIAPPASADTEAGGVAERRSSGDVEEVVVRGVRTRRILERPSAFETTIDADDYAGESRTLADLLGQQVGVQVRRFGGVGEPAELSIRGSTGSQVVVMLDGIRLNSTLTGSTDVSQLCLGLLQGANIARGGGGVTAGEGAIGGTVDLRTRRPGAEPVNRVEVTGASFGTWEATALRSGRAGPLEYSAGYCGFTTDGDYRFARPDIQVTTQPTTERPPITRINNDRVRHSANLSLGGEVGERGHVRASNYFTYSSHGEPGLDSGDDPIGGQNPFARGRDLQNIARLDLTVEDPGAFGDAFVLSAHHRYQRVEFRDPGVAANDEPIALRTEVHTLGVDASDHLDFDALAADHTFSALITARRDALYDTERPNVGRTTVAVAVNEEARWLEDRVALVPGVRLEWVQGIGETWLPALGIVLTPLPWLRVKGNVQRSYRAPGFDELYLPDKGFIRGNPLLLPERATNADAGVVFTFDALGPLEAVRFEGGVFQQEVDESIVFVPISPRTIAPVNTGPARVRGYELALAFELTRILRVEANHTGLDSRSETTGLPLPGRADNETNVRLLLGEGDRWKLVGEMHRTGAIPVSASGGIRLPSRILWSASASVNLAGFRALGLSDRMRALWLFAGLYNIGDVAARDALFFPQPGRNGQVGVEIEF